jgi:hypothetical protein
MDQSIQTIAQDLLDNRLSNHQEVLVKRVFKADPPIVLARDEIPISKGRTRYAKLAKDQGLRISSI